MLKLAAFPYKGVPYTECLYAALERVGVQVLEGDFSIRWLLSHVRTIHYFHFHWPSFAYSYPKSLSKTFHHLARFILFLLIIRIHGRHILWTAHNLYPHDMRGRISTVIHRSVRRLVVALASKIFVHGSTPERLLKVEFPGAAGKTVTIDHGHWIDYYENATTRGAARRQLGISEEAFVFLFVGLCRRYKNLRELIEAFEQLRGNVLLLIVGSFQDAAYLQEITDAVASDGERIRLVPQYVPDAALQVYLNACDTVVLPYSEILTSGAAMLAISFGRPVVAPRKGSLRDLIREDCGVLYDPADPRGLMAALTQIQARSFDGRRIVQYARTYDWHSVAEATYRTCVSCRSGFRCRTPPPAAGEPSPAATDHL